MRRAWKATRSLANFLGLPPASLPGAGSVSAPWVRKGIAMGSSGSLEGDRQQGTVTGSADRGRRAKAVPSAPGGHRTWQAPARPSQGRAPGGEGRQGPHQVAFPRGRIIR